MSVTSAFENDRFVGVQPLGCFWHAEACTPTCTTPHVGILTKHYSEDQEVLKQFLACQAAGVNMLLDAPPDNHGLVPQATIDALMRLRQNAKI